MKMKEISAMAVSEVHWCGCGSLEVEDALIVYSSPETSLVGNQRDTGIILRNKLKKA